MSIRGSTLRQAVRCTLGKDGMMVQFEDRQGTYKPWWTTMKVIVHGLSAPAVARLSGKAVPVSVDAAGKSVTVSIPDRARAADVVISRF